MGDPTTIVRSVGSALTKLSVALLFLLTLLAACCLANDPFVRGMVAVLLFVLVIPINALCSIDASRAIASQPNISRPVRILGAVLGVPQAILGGALVVIGFIYPFIGIVHVYRDIFDGVPVSQHLIWIAVSLVMLVVGYFYLKESLWLVLGRRGFRKQV